MAEPSSHARLPSDSPAISMPVAGSDRAWLVQPGAEERRSTGANVLRRRQVSERVPRIPEPGPGKTRPLKPVPYRAGGPTPRNLECFAICAVCSDVVSLLTIDVGQIRQGTSGTPRVSGFTES